ncbi:MAG: hypothetical protein KGL11_01175 [Alphaproteobacteria bacterium]|nr:hypothetical protein [Alphaproteobacteria bacterium]
MQRLFALALGLPPGAAPIRPLGDVGSRAPAGDRRDGAGREAERADIGFGGGDVSRRERHAGGREPRQAGNFGNKGGKSLEGGRRLVTRDRAHAASATSGSLSLR